MWRRTLVVAISKPEKPLGEPRSYRPKSLLWVPFKRHERLMYACVEPTIDLLPPQRQAGFRPVGVLRGPGWAMDPFPPFLTVLHWWHPKGQNGAVWWLLTITSFLGGTSFFWTAKGFPQSDHYRIAIFSAGTRPSKRLTWLHYNLQKKRLLRHKFSLSSDEDCHFFDNNMRKMP